MDISCGCCLCVRGEFAEVVYPSVSLVCSLLSLPPSSLPSSLPPSVLPSFLPLSVPPSLLYLPLPTTSPSFSCAPSSPSLLPMLPPLPPARSSSSHVQVQECEHYACWSPVCTLEGSHITVPTHSLLHGNKLLPSQLDRPQDRQPVS